MGSVRRNAKPAETPWGLWRWYSNVELCSWDDGPFPSSALPEILVRTGFRDLKSMMAALNKSQRNELPKPLQARLLRLFESWVSPKRVREKISLCIDSDKDRKRNRKSKYIELPYPFSANGSPEAAEVIVAAFNIKEHKPTATLTIYASISVAVSNLLGSQAPIDADFCCLAAGNGFEGGLDFAEQNVVRDWLIRKGIKASLAQAMVDDESTLGSLDQEINDRIEWLIGVSGPPEICDSFREGFYLQGEEEKGFSLG